MQIVPRFSKKISISEFTKIRHFK